MASCKSFMCSSQLHQTTNHLQEISPGFSLDPSAHIEWEGFRAGTAAGQQGATHRRRLQTICPRLSHFIFLCYYVSCVSFVCVSLAIRCSSLVSWLLPYVSCCRASLCLLVSLIGQGNAPGVSHPLLSPCIFQSSPSHSCLLNGSIHTPEPGPLFVRW